MRPAASGGRYKRERNSVAILCFCSCHCSSFPITLHLYYTSARAGQQGCLCLGTLCLEVETGHNRSYSPLFAGAGSPSACPARTARFPQIQSLHQSHRCKSSMDFLPPAKTERSAPPGERGVKGHTAHIRQGLGSHCADVNAFHLFQFLCR